MAKPTRYPKGVTNRESWLPSGNLPVPDLSYWHHYFEDFIGPGPVLSSAPTSTGATCGSGWIYKATTTTGTATIGHVYAHGGTNNIGASSVRITTGTTANDLVIIGIDNGAQNDFQTTACLNENRDAYLGVLFAMGAVSTGNGLVGMLDGGAADFSVTSRRGLWVQTSGTTATAYMGDGTTVVSGSIATVPAATNCEVQLFYDSSESKLKGAYRLRTTGDTVNYDTWTRIADIDTSTLTALTGNTGYCMPSIGAKTTAAAAFQWNVDYIQYARVR